MAITVTEQSGFESFKFVEKPADLFNGGSTQNRGFQKGILANILPDESYDMARRFAQMADRVESVVHASENDAKLTVTRRYKVEGGKLSSFKRGKKKRYTIGAPGEAVLDVLNRDFVDCVQKIQEDLMSLPEALRDQTEIRLYSGQRAYKGEVFGGCHFFHGHRKPTYIKTYTPGDTTFVFTKEAQLPVGADVYFSGKLAHAAPCGDEPRVVAVSFAPGYA